MTDAVPPDPLISVLIPAYRAEETLAGAVGALLAGPNGALATEILVEADDDNAYAAVAALSPRVKVARSGLVGTGAGAARNRALARARGVWVAYVDADDRVDDDWLPQLLAAAGQGVAALSQMAVWEGGALLGILAPGRLDWAGAARHGASWRGIFRRDACPAFAEDLSQDILHLAQVMMAAGGRLPVAPVRYHLQLAAGSVTAANDFAARVEAAYHRHIARLEAAFPGHPELAGARALFRAKIALNAEHAAAGTGESYYRWVMGRT